MRQRYGARPRVVRQLREPSSRAVVFPYKIGSKSGRLLAEKLTDLLGLRVRRVRYDGLYRPNGRSLIVNYGSGSRPAWAVAGSWLNKPEACARSGNKLSALRAFQAAGLSIPEFTTDAAQAQRWVNGGATAVCRTALNGHSGRGIVLTHPGGHVVYAPLYTKYKKKRKEFRVHVFQGQVIDVAEKRKRREAARLEQYEGYVRNLANGYVYCRDGVVRPAGLDQLAVGACAAVGLDFAAADIIWNEYENRCYLLEVNTAPGLEGTTLVNYANAIANWIRRQA